MAQHRITYNLRDIKPPYVGGHLEINKTAIREFYFIESIENMFLSGKLEIEDAGGLFEKLPLTGEETIEVIIEQDIEDDSGERITSVKSLTFDIYNVELGEAERYKTTTYIFQLVERGFFDFVNKNYSKSYNQQFISSIVGDICKNQLDLLSAQYDIEATADKVDFVIPYWKPLVSLKHFTRIARRKKLPKESGYLFYSTTGDEDTETPIKKFVSFATLLDVNPSKSEIDKYYYKKQNINPNFINNFQEMRNPHFKNKSRIKDGLSGKKYYGVDLTTDKTLLTVEKTYSDYITNVKMLGSKAYLSNIVDDVDSEVKFFGYTNTNLTQAHLDYRFRMSLESFNKREVLVDGTLSRFCGKTIYVEQSSDNPEELHNIENSGTWIIKTVTHYFTINSFQQKMILLKNAYEDSEAEGLIEL